MKTAAHQTVSTRKKALFLTLGFHTSCFLLWGVHLFHTSPPKKKLQAIPVQFLTLPPKASKKHPPESTPTKTTSPTKQEKSTPPPQKKRTSSPLPVPKKKKGKKIKPKIKTKQKKTSPTKKTRSKKTNKKNSSISKLLKKSTLSEAQQSSLIASIQQQLMQCWNTTQALREAKNLKITIRLHMKKNGMIKSTDIITKKSTTKHPKFQMGKASVLQAVNHPKCTPITLPEDHYEDWKEIILTFSTDDL